MKVHVEELDNWMRQIRIGLPESEVDARYSDRMDAYVSEFEAPGFRKGKAPRGMVEGKFQNRARAEAIESLMPEAIANAVKEAGLRPVCDPIVENMETAPTDGHYHFTTTIGVRPEIELKEYEGLAFTEQVPVVSNEDVERAVEELRERNADLAPVTRPSAAGDYVFIDYDRLDNEGNPVPDARVEGAAYELGAGQVPPELEAVLTGASTGDEKSVAIPFPEDAGVEEFAGKTVNFSVKVNEVRQKLLPPVDEAFAKKVANAETVLDLRVKVRGSLEAQAKSYGRRRLEEEMVKTLIEKNPFELPECLMRERLDAMRESAQEKQPEGAPAIDQAQFDEVYRKIVEHQLKAGLLFGAIAEKHDVDVTDADVEKRVTEIAESQGKKTEDLIKDLEGSDMMGRLKDDLWLGKVHEFVLGLSNVTTEEVEMPREGDGGDEGE